MRNRFRVEIYDANKANDLTIYSEQGVDKEYLTELVFSNLRRFNGRVNAYVVDTLKKGAGSLWSRPTSFWPPMLRGYPQPYGSYPQCPENL